MTAFGGGLYQGWRRNILNKGRGGYAGGLNLYAYVGNNPVNYADPFGLSKSEEIVRGGYQFIKYAGDLMHGGEHWHVFTRRTGELLGRVSLSGEVLTGSVPKTALKYLIKLGRIGGVGISIVSELAFPNDAGASEDMLPPDFGKDYSLCSK